MISELFKLVFKLLLNGMKIFLVQTVPKYHVKIWYKVKDFEIFIFKAPILRKSFSYQVTQPLEVPNLEKTEYIHAIDTTL